VDLPEEVEKANNKGSRARGFSWPPCNQKEPTQAPPDAPRSDLRITEVADRRCVVGASFECRRQCPTPRTPLLLSPQLVHVASPAVSSEADEELGPISSMAPKLVTPTVAAPEFRADTEGLHISGGCRPCDAMLPFLNLFEVCSLGATCRSMQRWPGRMREAKGMREASKRGRKTQAGATSNFAASHRPNVPVAQRSRKVFPFRPQTVWLGRGSKGSGMQGAGSSMPKKFSTDGLGSLQQRSMLAQASP